MTGCHFHLLSVYEENGINYKREQVYVDTALVFLSLGIKKFQQWGKQRRKSDASREPSRRRRERHRTAKLNEGESSQTGEESEERKMNWGWEGEEEDKRKRAGPSDKDRSQGGSTCSTHLSLKFTAPKSSYSALHHWTWPSDNPEGCPSFISATCWCVLFSDSVFYTNLSAANSALWSEPCVEEMNAFIGINILMGIHKLPALTGPLVKPSEFHTSPVKWPRTALSIFAIYTSERSSFHQPVWQVA